MEKRKRTATSNTELEHKLEESPDLKTNEEKVTSASLTILEAELDFVKFVVYFNKYFLRSSERKKSLLWLLEQISKESISI